jgi:hypothetical protein
LTLDEGSKQAIEAGASGIVMAALTYIGMLLRIRTGDRRRDQEREDRLEGQKLEYAGKSNQLLFDELKRQITSLEERCSECEIGRAELRAHAMAQQEWLVDLRAAAVVAGINVPDPPVLTATLLDGRSVASRRPQLFSGSAGDGEMPPG